LLGQLFSFVSFVSSFGGVGLEVFVHLAFVDGVNDGLQRFGYRCVGRGVGLVCHLKILWPYLSRSGGWPALRFGPLHGFTVFDRNGAVYTKRSI